MARKSSFAHLKPKILQEFDKGNLPKDLLKIFPQIPPGTIYGWYSECQRKNSETEIGQGFLPDTPPAPGAIEAKSNVLKLVPKENDEDLSNFDLAVKVLREIIRDRTTPPSVKVQASMALLRSIELSKMLKKQSQPETNFEPIDFSTMSDRELQILAAQM